MCGRHLRIPRPTDRRSGSLDRLPLSHHVVRALTESGLRHEQEILGLADRWFLPAHVVSGQLNFLPVTRVFSRLQQLIADRG